VGLTIPHHKKLLLRNLKRGGQGPIWAVGPLDGWSLVYNGTKFRLTFLETSALMSQLGAYLTFQRSVALPVGTNAVCKSVDIFGELHFNLYDIR
jgi:hypothetical protein